MSREAFLGFKSFSCCSKSVKVKKLKWKYFLWKFFFYFSFTWATFATFYSSHYLILNKVFILTFEFQIQNFDNVWKEVTESFNNILIIWNYFIIIYQSNLIRIKSFDREKLLFSLPKGYVFGNVFYIKVSEKNVLLFSQRFHTIKFLSPNNSFTPDHNSFIYRNLMQRTWFKKLDLLFYNNFSK